MASSEPRAGLFSALLKHWRGHRGMSQLDLAVAANVSSRHISFLETGRSVPSLEMVLRLAATLDVPLRQVDAMLEAAGHPPRYPEPGPGAALPAEVAQAVALMKAHHEPFPLVVLDRRYDLLDLNGGAAAVFRSAVPTLELGGGPLNLLRLVFDPRGAHPAIMNFDEVGRALLWRVHREVLADPDDGVLRRRLDEVLSLPTVGADFRAPDLTVPSSPALVIRLRAGAHELRFLTTVTAFQAPHTLQLDALRIETWFPIDDETAAACRSLAGRRQDGGGAGQGSERASSEVELPAEHPRESPAGA
ncbi:MAG: helix-turn-helix transcriptional regulator [Deltaproteobacteria bacterium]|nr:helix-turn-helix transcriptional regulator [Deltaproteobacteria bacterium]